VILEVQPGHDDARALLAEIESRTSVAHSEAVEDAAEAVTPATTGDLTARFRDVLDGRAPGPRVRRLSLWLARTQRNRGARHDR